MNQSLDQLNMLVSSKAFKIPKAFPSALSFQNNVLAY